VSKIKRGKIERERGRGNPQIERVFHIFHIESENRLLHMDEGVPSSNRGGRERVLRNDL